LYATLAFTGLPPLGVSVKLIVLACTASLNAAVTAAAAPTLDWAPEAGASLVTYGAGVAAVVKDHVKGDVIGWPALFSAPLTVAV
jgi:hypothetical protein